uniref:Uncharacterized protein n=1 Tax=Arundo donax TaxID=35708 RepID=A0A0A9ANY9_ARUDO
MIAFPALVLWCLVHCAAKHSLLYDSTVLSLKLAHASGEMKSTF